MICTLYHRTADKQYPRNIMIGVIKRKKINLPCIRAQQSGDVLNQVWDALLISYPYTPCRMRGDPKVSKSNLAHSRPAWVIVCDGHFVVAGDTGGSSINPPSQTVTLVFGCSEHMEQPQLVSPVISLPCHMIRAVCNNTRGAGAGLVRKWDDPWLTA